MAEENNAIISKYLDRAGLSVLWDKIKLNFASKAELSTLQNEHDSDLADINAELSDINTELDGLKSSVAETVVKAVDNVTLKSEEGKISTALGLDIDSESKMIRLIATGSSVTDETKVISSIPYSQFVKDGILSNVELVIIEEAPEGENQTQEPGTYLKFTFNTDSGKDAIYVNVSDMIDVYTGEGYIVVDGDKISLNYVSLKNDLTEELSSTFVKLEDYNSDKENINETINNNSTKIAELLDRLGVVENIVADHTQSIEGIQANIEAIQSDIENLTEKNGQLSLGLAGLNETIEQNSAQISQLWTQLGLKVSQEDFNKLSEKVTVNETSIDELESRIAGLEGAMNPDGELVTISIQQVVDFKPLTTEDINEVCSDVNAIDQTVIV